MGALVLTWDKEGAQHCLTLFASKEPWPTFVDTAKGWNVMRCAIDWSVFDPPKVQNDLTSFLA